MRLKIGIRQLSDGRFCVTYYWHFWESTHKQYFKDKEGAMAFVSELVMNTRWKY